MDEDLFEWLIGDDERRILDDVDDFLISIGRSPYDETDERESSSNKVFVLEFGGLFGVENKSRISSDCSMGSGLDDIASRSWSCSESDGVETDETADDERCFRDLEASCFFGSESALVDDDEEFDLSLGTIVKTPSTISNMHSCSSIWMTSIFESILSFNKRLTGLNDGW